MKKLIYFALVLPMAMLVIACGEKTKELLCQRRWQR